jgi:hypothetical protein
LKSLPRGLVLGCILLAAPGAYAQQTERPAGAPAPVDEAPVVAEFPPDKDVCYGRIYSREHLAAHPRQKVTEIYLARLLSQDPEAEGETKTREQFAAAYVQSERASKADIPAYTPKTRPGRTDLEVYVRFRDKPGLFLGAVECRGLTAGGFTCGIACDGGGFTAKLNGKTLILRQSGSLRVQAGCSGDDESAPEVTINTEDDGLEFHLEPAPAATCERAREGYRPAWATLGKPLRQRLADNPAACFSRVYDEAHLKAHPKQLVKSVSLQRTPAPPKTDPEAREWDHHFRVRFELRDGRVLDKATVCSTSTYAIQCDAAAEDSAGSFKLMRGTGKSVMLGETYHQEGSIAQLLGLEKVEDDHSFRLEETDAASCK